MKKLTLIVLMFVATSLLSIPGQARTLKIATLAPAGTSWMKEMKKGAKAIKKKTNGRVKIKFYPGGVMGNDQSINRKIRINQLQGGAFSSSGLSHIDTSIQALSLPMLFKNFDEVDHVRKHMDKVIKQRMADKGFIILGITEGGFARILSTQPIHSMQNIRDSKVWIPEGDELVQQTYDTMGINPIALPISDVFTGLQTGLIETISATSTGAIAFQWHSKLSYMVDTPVLYVIGVLAVNKKAFDKIKPADQQVVLTEMEQVFKALDQMNRKDNINATQALANQDIQVITPTAEEVASWQAYSDQSIQHMIDKGKIDQAIVTQIQGLLSEYRNR